MIGFGALKVVTVLLLLIVGGYFLLDWYESTRPLYPGRTPASGSTEIKVLTYNTWLLDLPFGCGSQIVDKRLRRLPEAIANTEADLIALQEVWHRSHRKYLTNEMKRFGYKVMAPDTEKMFRFGTGLMFFSKYEMAEGHRMMNFSQVTRVDENFTNKGIVGVRVNVPKLGWIDFFNAHLGAVTFDEDTDQCVLGEAQARFEQTKDLVQWVHANSSEDIKILAGDFNTHYKKYMKGCYINEQTKEYRLLVEEGYLNKGLGWIDTFRKVNPNESNNFCTFDRNNKFMCEGHLKTQPSATIDYIFVNDNKKLIPKASKLVFTGKNHILSDHYGVLSKLEFTHENEIKSETKK